MTLKGNLQSTSLDELFETLAETGRTGILSFQSEQGEKQIAFSRGELALQTDRLTRRVRLGDLLIGRGKLNEEKLKEALAIQREEKPPAKLGAILINRKFVTPEDVQSALRFQLEEELCDLLTWSSAEFQFDESRRSLTEEDPPPGAAETQTETRKLAVDPREVLAEASRRTKATQEFIHRLSSPYLCFRISQKGEDNFKEAKDTTRTLLRMVREGRTLETIVKNSYLGRMMVYKAIIDLLDQGWISPYPGSELRFLASEHRAQGRYLDALFIYRRLLENAPGEKEKLEYRRLIEDTTETILREEVAGKQPEGLEAVRYKGAAEKYFRRRRIRFLLGFGGALTALILGASYWLEHQDRGRPNANYLAVLHDSETAIGRGQYTKAIEIWTDFYEAQPDKESEFAKQVREKLGRVMRQYSRAVESRFNQAELLAKEGKLDEAERSYQQILEEFPNNALADRIAQAQKQLEVLRVEQAQSRTLKALDERIARAQDLIRKQHFQKAQELLRELLQKTTALTALRQAAETDLANLQKIEQHAREAYLQGLQETQAGHAEAALEHFKAAAEKWPELEWAQKAGRQSQELRLKQSRLRELLASARVAEARGAVAEAAATLKRIQEEFKEFEEARGVSEKLASFDSSLTEARQLLKDAQSDFQRQDWKNAKEHFAELLRKHQPYLLSQKAAIPIEVLSTPPGAQVALNGQPAGQTPLFLPLNLDGIHRIRFSLAGFSSEEQTLRGLRPEDLTLTVRLQRAALLSLDLQAPILAPPLLHKERLCIAAGSSLFAYTHTGDRLLWKSEPLLDDSATYRPHSSGNQQPVFVSDRSWWFQRAPLLLDETETLLAPTQAGTVLSIPLATGQATLLLKLPVESEGALHLERGALLAGKSLLAAACADGQLRVYDLTKPAKPLWAKAMDEAAHPDCGPVTGILPAGMGIVASASRGGKIRSWTLIAGENTWPQLNLNRRLIFASTPQADLVATGEFLTAFITDHGEVHLVDQRLGKIRWSYPPERQADGAATVTVTVQGAFVSTQGGKLIRLPLHPHTGQEVKPLWNRPLSDFAVPPALKDELLFVATHSSALYALAIDSGQILWQYKLPSKPTHLLVAGDRLYACTAGGQVVVLRAER